MKKYYIGFAILLAVCIGAVIYTAGQGASAKTDKATDSAVEEFSNKVGDNYNLTSAPASLAAAGIKDAPSTVTYTKLSDSKYKICFDYKNPAGGFDAGWTGLFSGALGAAGDSSSSGLASGDGYFDSTVESTHKKGQNCQTVTLVNYNQPDDYTVPPNSGTGSDINTDSSDSTATTDSCVSAVEPQVAGQLVVAGVDTAAQTISFSADNQSVYDQAGNQVPTITSKTYDANTVFCLNDAVASAAALKAGDNVTVYLSSSTAPTLDEVQDYQ